MSSAIMLLAPELKASVAGVKFASRLKKLWYRGVWKRHGPSCGAQRALLLNRGKADAFDLGNGTGNERDELIQLGRFARQFGGHYFVSWTYSNVLFCAYVWGDATSREDSIRSYSLRLTPLSAGRSRSSFDGFLHWFDDSPFTPDQKTLEEQFLAPRVSVVAWMEAFGVAGAREVGSHAAEEDWDDLKRVAEALTRGGAPDRGATKRVNAQVLLSEAGHDAELPLKPPRKRTLLASRIFLAKQGLEEALGPSGDRFWIEVTRAAGSFWDFSTSAEVRKRMTVGTDKQGLGTSASVARLMMHYPPEFFRSGILWALAAYEAEGANGHAYVEGLDALTHSCHDAGMTLTVFPKEQHVAFRKAFGIQPSDQHPVEEGDWAAEGFVPLPGVLKVDPQQRIKSWFKKTRSDGLCISGASLSGPGESAYELIAFEGGQPGIDPVHLLCSQIDIPGLEVAVRALNFSDVCKALGLPDLFAPGSWQKGTCPSLRHGSDGESEAQGVTKKPVLETPIVDVFELFSDREIVPTEECLLEVGVEICQFWITLPEVDAPFQAELASDLRQEALTDGGSVTIQGTTIFGRVDNRWRKRCRPFSRFFWRAALVDLPVGTALHFEIGKKLRPLSYILDPVKAAERSSDGEIRSRCTEAQPLTRQVKAGKTKEKIDFREALKEGVGDEAMVTRVLLKSRDRGHYFEVDISSIEHARSVDTKRLEESAKAFGFSWVGDIHRDVVENLVHRCLTLDGRPDIWLAISIDDSDRMMRKLINQFLVFTEFDDGSTLVSTHEAIGVSKATGPGSRTVYPKALSLEALVEAHLGQVDQMADGSRSPKASGHSLDAMASCLEKTEVQLFK